MGLTIKEIEVKSVLTKSNLPVSDYSVNPYVGCTFACKYCYASFMKRFTNHPEPWGDFLDVKTWAKIKNPQKYAGKEMFLGSVTDPYNPQEKKYERTRTLLQEMQGSGIKLSISTKSDLVLRDLELIKTFPDARVAWSINTLDEAFRREAVPRCGYPHNLFYLAHFPRNYRRKSDYRKGKRSVQPHLARKSKP